jgi:hypothetical protein
MKYVDQRVFYLIEEINRKVWGLNDQLKSKVTLSDKLALIRERDNLLEERTKLLAD